MCFQIRQPAPGNSGPRTGAAPAGVLTHSTHSGGVGAPPGDTTIPSREPADRRRECPGKRGPAPQGERRSRAPRGAPAYVTGR